MRSDLLTWTEYQIAMDARIAEEKARRGGPMRLYGQCNKHHVRLIQADDAGAPFTEHLDAGVWIPDFSESECPVFGRELEEADIDDYADRLDWIDAHLCNRTWAMVIEEREERGA